MDVKTMNYIATALTTINKYEPGKHKFFLQALTPTQNRSTEFTNDGPTYENILNKDIGALNLNGASVGSCIELELPKEITRWFDVKFIPPGTRFVVSLGNGITKLKIVGRDFFNEQGGYNGLDSDNNAQDLSTYMKKINLGEMQNVE